MPTRTNPAAHAPSSTTPAPSSGVDALSEADRARRNEEAKKIESALDFAWRRIEQFSEEVSGYINARSHALV